MVSEIHGTTGLDGSELSRPTASLDPRHAVPFLIDVLMAHPPKAVTLVPIGPLTNIALALRQEPEISTRLKRIVLMGGSYAVHGRTPVAEFNIVADPEAAPIHDACAVAYTIDKNVFSVRPAHVTVETGGRHSYGQTVIDFRGQLGQPANADVAITLDTERFWSLMIDAMRALPDQNTHQPHLQGVK